MIEMPLYFFSFLFMIKRYNLPTPGRGGKLVSKAEYKAIKQAASSSQIDSNTLRAYHLVEAYGGAANIENTDACITKLRVTVKDPSKIDTERLKEQGSSGNINIYGNYVVAIFGTESDNLRTAMLKVIKGQVDLEELRSLTSSNKPAPNLEVGGSKEGGLAAGESLTILAPVTGKILSLASLEDESFMVLGQGVAIEPTSTSFKSPIKEGVLELVFPTKHAYIFTRSNLKIMVHVGIDSVKLAQGGGEEGAIERTFMSKLEAGSPVNREAFLSVSWRELDSLAKSDPKVKRTTPVIVLNEELEGHEVSLLVEEGASVKVGDPIFEIKRIS